jgi:hypothetical protein
VTHDLRDLLTVETAGVQIEVGPPNPADPTAAQFPPAVQLRNSGRSRFTSAEIAMRA